MQTSAPESTDPYVTEYSIEPAPVLAGAGPTLIHAAVPHSPTPQVPPADLSGLVIPVRDADGTVRDWKLAADPDGAHTSDPSRSAFARWHEGFISDAIIGDVATARSLMHWARGRVELSEAGILRLPHARISARHSRRLAWQLHEASEACDKLHARGLGVSAPGRDGLARGFVVADGPVMLLAEGGSWVAATGGGLLLNSDGLAATSAGALVTGWTTDGTGLTATTDQGELDLSGTTAGALLRRVAPGLTTAVVRDVPLTKVFAGLFVTLADMALLAAVENSTLLIDRSGSIADAT